MECLHIDYIILKSMAFKKTFLDCISYLVNGNPVLNPEWV